MDRALCHYDLELARQRLAASFLASAEDGRLERALSSNSDMDVLRQRVSARMLAAAEDGRLDVAMDKQNQVHQEHVRAQAAASLLKAAEDGQLENMLALNKLDDIRSRVAASIASSKWMADAYEAMTELRRLDQACMDSTG
eukprot:Skav225380  [mRNA]  locus=scaffold3431:56075:63190:- [translate_table: standard]